MALDSEFLLKVKECVTTKLKNLGAFIDDELPDYIMVMVANNKSEGSMARDLQLFLGEHTEGFTKWLHSILQSLRHDDQALKVKEKGLKESTKVKSEKKKASKVRDSPRPNRSDARDHQRSRSRSPLLPSKHDSGTSLSREPHAQSDAFRMHSDDCETTPDEIINGNITSTIAIQEERKVVSTALLRRSRSSRSESASEEQEKANVRSVVAVRNSSPPKQRPRVSRTAAKHINPSSLLLKKAFNDVKANAEPPENVSPGQTGRKNTYRPVACPDVSSSSSSSDRTKFYVTLSGGQTVPSSVVFHADSSMEPDRFRERSGMDISSSRSSVKSRLGSRRVLPYSRPPIAEKLSAKERLGPVIHSRSTLTPVALSPADAESTYEDLDEEQVETVELVEGESDGDELSETGEEFGDYVDTEDQRIVHTPSDSMPVQKPRLIDRLNQRQLVVNLNETDEDDDLLSPIKNAGGQKKIQQKTIKDDVESDRAHIPSSLDRCRYWPNCRNGNECPYIHPSEPCPTFPRCRLGSTCTYIHPPCRFDAACTRPDCAFTHTAKRPVVMMQQNPVSSLVSPVSVSQVVCRFQSRCTNLACPFYHPPSVIQPVPMVMQSSSRSAVVTGAPGVPLATSPVPCRYGSSCTNRPKCPFLHRDVPRPEQLKWVAPSKRTDGTDPGTPVASVTGSQPAALQAETVK